MFLDIVGFSAMMAADERRAMGAVAGFEALLRELAPQEGGRLVKSLGDGGMVEFPTAGGAVRAAEALQREAARRGGGFAIRIGLHVGEVQDKDGDLFGDAVNIAARVMPLAAPGGIAMTETVYEQVKNRLELPEPLRRSVALKNIPNRTAVCLFPPGGASASASARLRERARPLAALAAALLAAAGGWAGYRHWRGAAGPARFGMLYILSDNAPPSVDMSREIEDRLGREVAASPGLQWVHRNAIRELFDAEGIGDITAVEKLERKACAVAQKGGLQYSLVAKLERLDAGRWRLRSDIICTDVRAVVGTIEAAGATAEAIAGELVGQLRAWARGYNLIPRKDLQTSERG